MNYLDTVAFSESEALNQLFSDGQFCEMLAMTSSSDADLANRVQVYSDVMCQFEDLKEKFKSFSGMSEIPIHSNQYFNASMASYVRSFAGYLSIERAMDQPTTLLWFNDLLGITDNRVVLPNIGQENLKGINARFQAQSSFIQGQYCYTIATNKKLLPGSVEVNFTHKSNPSNPVIIKDDRKGNLLAPAGVLAANENGIVSVNYVTGNITFTLPQQGGAFQFEDGDTYSIIGYEDVAGDPAFGQLTGPGNNRFKVDMKHIEVKSEPDMLVGESNLMAIAAANKAVGFNPQTVMGQKLTELYTKLINEKMANGIIQGAQGNEFTIDMARYIDKFNDYTSRLDAFQSDLVDVDTEMAKRTHKATKATAYLVGESVGNYFRKLKNTGSWVDNTESTYINDLLGFFNGVPVLRHINCERNVGYAIHKTPGGEIAPIMRGIFLPLTNTPMVGNYNNPTQFAQGIYYQESNELIFPELIQKFNINDVK